MIPGEFPHICCDCGRLNILKRNSYCENWRCSKCWASKWYCNNKAKRKVVVDRYNRKHKNWARLKAGWRYRYVVRARNPKYDNRVCLSCGNIIMFEAHGNRKFCGGCNWARIIYVDNQCLEWYPDRNTKSPLDILIEEEDEQVRKYL